MKLGLRGRRSAVATRLCLIALIAVSALLTSPGSVLPGGEARASVGAPACNAAVARLNKSLVLIAKRRIQARNAKRRGESALRRAKRNLRRALKHGAAVRAAVQAGCRGDGSVSSLDAKCSLAIDRLAYTIDLRYTRTLRYKRVKVRGKKGKARARALKRKRAMKTALKRFDDRVRAESELVAKDCGGGPGDGSGGGPNGGGGGSNGGGGLTGGQGPNGGGSGGGGSNGGGPTGDQGPTSGEGPTGPTGGEGPTGDHDPTGGEGPTGGSGGSPADTTPPGAVVIIGPDGPTHDNTPSVELIEPETGGTTFCNIDGETGWVAVTSPWTLPQLADGVRVVTCHYVDAAGNIGPDSSIAITVDTTPPGAIVITGPSGTINDDTPQIGLSGGEGSGHYECRIDGGAWFTVTSPFTLPPLADGTHTVTCRFVDAAGNAGAETVLTFTVDTAGPVVSIADGPAKWNGTHSFSLTANEAVTGFECKLDGGAYATVSATFVTPVLANGSHTVACRATDLAGNIGAASTESFGVFKDPTTVTKTGGFKWGLGCSFSSTLNQLLGCPDAALKIVIPANPNGLTGSYLVDLAGYVNDINSLFGSFTTYKMSITVDGASVATDGATLWLSLCGLTPVDLSASKANISLSADAEHTITIRLKTSAAIDLLPSVGSSGLSVSIHH